MDYETELADLYDIYEKTKEKTAEQLEQEHGCLIHAMKRYISAYDQHARIKQKIANLECKLDNDDECDCDEESDD